MTEKGDGGEGGIRTLERVAPLPVFKTGAFNRSATSPMAGKHTEIPACMPAPNELIFPLEALLGQGQWCFCTCDHSIAQRLRAWQNLLGVKPGGYQLAVIKAGIIAGSQTFLCN